MIGKFLFLLPQPLGMEVLELFHALIINLALMVVFSALTMAPQMPVIPCSHRLSVGDVPPISPSGLFSRGDD